MSRVAIYARVSTFDQTTAVQLDRLRAIAPGAEEYVDEAVSGRLASRPAFDRLSQAISLGLVQEVYVCKLDRLGRSASRVLEFFELAEEHGTRVVVADQQMDTSTPVGRLIRTVLAAMAELEADLIAERTREAMAAFKAGTRQPKSPVGRPRVVTREKVERAAQIRRENPGITWSDLAQHVGLKRETIRRALRSMPRPPLIERRPVVVSDGGPEVP